MKTKFLTVLFLFSVLLAGAQAKLTNKEKAVALIASLENGDHTPISYVNPNKYIQHNLAVGDGLAGFGELMKHKPEGGFKAKVVRAYQEGDYVVLHTEYDFFGPKIGFDIFRFENGLIVEHWDNLQTTETQTKSGHSMTDGPAVATDLKKTAANKNLIKAFYADVLVPLDGSKIGKYVGDKYTQHNPGGADGKEAFAGLIKMAKEQSWFKINKTHLIIAEGDFVFVQSEGVMGGKDAAFYDLFRVENGKVAEHWDVIETLIPKDQWKNNNGKF